MEKTSRIWFTNVNYVLSWRFLYVNKIFGYNFSLFACLTLVLSRDHTVVILADTGAKPTKCLRCIVAITMFYSSALKRRLVEVTRHRKKPFDLLWPVMTPVMTPAAIADILSDDSTIWQKTELWQVSNIRSLRNGICMSITHLRHG